VHIMTIDWSFEHGRLHNTMPVSNFLMLVIGKSK
jgi:hypothetical protein